MLYKLRASRHWIETGIVVHESKIASELDVIKYARLQYFYPCIEYSYTVDSICVKNSTVSFDKKGIWVDTETEAERLLNALLRDKKAFYNPAKPTESVMMREMSPKRRSHYKSMILAGLMLISISIAVSNLV